MVNIFIAGMDPSVSRKQLIACFEQFGVVEKAFIPKHRGGQFDGESRGFAFVEMTNANEARAAIETLNNSLWRDRRLKVVVARCATKPRHDRAKTVNSESGTA